jgi:hypothetical protein
MSNSTPHQLRVTPSVGFSICADLNGRRLSSDLGQLFLHSTNQQIGLTSRLAAKLDDRPHPGYVKHSLCNLLTQHISQIATDYKDGNDSNKLRQFRESHRESFLAESKTFRTASKLALPSFLSRQ